MSCSPVLLVVDVDVGIQNLAGQGIDVVFILHAAVLPSLRPNLEGLLCEVWSLGNHGHDVAGFVTPFSVVKRHGRDGRLHAVLAAAGLASEDLHLRALNRVLLCHKPKRNELVRVVVDAATLGNAHLFIAHHDLVCMDTVDAI